MNVSSFGTLGSFYGTKVHFALIKWNIQVEGRKFPPNSDVSLSAVSSVEWEFVSYGQTPAAIVVMESSCWHIIIVNNANNEIRTGRVVDHSCETSYVKMQGHWSRHVCFLAFGIEYK